MDILTKQAMNIEALKARKGKAEKDFTELMKLIGESAADGEFEVYFVKNKWGEDYPCISAEQVDTLKSAGFKVTLYNGHKDWDKLHRFYKGMIKVSWK